ncbi:40S ribosomal protein S11 (nucleomorph) [Guillardia theta]|uniref:Small ribosomal subunit protein uS17 n=1 Tax=Guillardia theta TaxID=55529 RepID=Q98S88_GUITH|nr:40S ribosomal protein S11 [Guillardia theta]AAK39694.1 40S ribosomal protein S11 [Guillardia theta]|mmetsp:Transcript_18082/g.59390  ORF Transcript_18082/g.59390 Transcript_18082/m.59390 type:complete len:139 (-) Transcript_18082:1162-1578(-)
MFIIKGNDTRNKKIKKKLKNIGLDIKIRNEGKNISFIDKKCPFTGNISIRGRIMKGKIVSTKMEKTVIVRRDYLHWIPKYKRFEKRHKNIPCHCSPLFRVKEGDFVTIGQCRPLSKTVRFNVIHVEKDRRARNKKIYS